MKKTYQQPTTTCAPIRSSILCASGASNKSIPVTPISFYTEENVG